MAIILSCFKEKDYCNVTVLSWEDHYYTPFSFIRVLFSNIIFVQLSTLFMLQWGTYNYDKICVSSSITMSLLKSSRDILIPINIFMQLDKWNKMKKLIKNSNNIFRTHLSAFTCLKIFVSKELRIFLFFNIHFSILAGLEKINTIS